MTEPEEKKCYSCDEIIPVGDACCADCVGKVVEHYIADTKAKVLKIIDDFKEGGDILTADGMRNRIRKRIEDDLKEAKPEGKKCKRCEAYKAWDKAYNAGKKARDKADKALVKELKLEHTCGKKAI